MIIVKCKSGTEFIYIGQIYMQMTTSCLLVKAISGRPMNYKGELNTWDRKVFDMFWLTDIKEIVNEPSR